MSSGGPKQAIFASLAEIAQALGHAHRLELLEHLVEPRRDGKRMLYSLSGAEEVVRLLHALGRVGERNVAEIERVMAAYFRARDELEPVSRASLVERVRDGLVIVLDVRPEDEFALGHLPGALNVPLSALERHLAELPREREIVAYCRGPYCVLSFEAVAALRARGYRVRRLEDGYPEWRAAGLPVEAIPTTGAAP
jgi:ArsR family transcriptional regulator